MAFIAIVQQSATTFLTKMNGLPLIHLALDSSSSPPCCGRGRLCGPRRFSQQLRSNTSLRSLAPRQLQMSKRNVLELPPNILTPTILPHRRQRYQRQLTPSNLIPDKCFTIRLVVLEEDFRLREDAYLTFSPEVNNSIIREAIWRFQVNIENALKHMDHFCCCCSQFIDPLKLESIPNNNVILMVVFKTYILHCYYFDIYSYCSKSFNFCYDC